MLHHTKTKYIHNTALLFILITPFTVVYYASYVFNPAHAGNIYAYIAQLIADGIAIMTVGTLWLTILLDLIQPDHHKRDLKHNKHWLDTHQPYVDILVPVVNEPKKIMENTITHIMNLDYERKKIYILDDGNSDQTRSMAAQFGIGYISRPKKDRRHAKSGNLNYALSQTKGEFFAVFDADHAPKKTFLKELLPFFENEKVALVQSPQHYVNTDNYIASGTAQAQEIFYKYVQPAKNSYNAAFCVGTNMVYRRSAIDDIGGVTLTDHSEDIWTTINLHEKGYESVFYNKILAEGRAPETIPSFFRQQNRWSRGGFALFFSHNPLLSDKLTLDQRIQYFFSNVHYFTAFSVLIYLLIPVAYLLTGVHPMDVKHNEGWIAHYIPYFITIYFLPWFLLGSIKLSTLSTSFASFSPYIKAFVSVVLRNEYKWVATEGTSTKPAIIMTDIWPHVFIIVLSLTSLLVGWYNTDDFITTLITSFWVIFNSYILVEFITNGYFKKTVHHE